MSFRKKHGKKYKAPKTTDDFVELLKEHNHDKQQFSMRRRKSYDFIKRNEGDVWEENGKKWTIEDGVKISVRKFDREKLGLMPNFCPKCSKMMKERDKPYWTPFKCCLDCSAAIITDMKIKGTWINFINNKEKENFKSMLKEKKNILLDTLPNIGKMNVVANSSGEVENWDMTDSDIEKQKSTISNRIVEIDKVIEEVDNYESMKVYFDEQLKKAKELQAKEEQNVNK